MIVWGGDGISYSNTGGKYDPGLNTWTATSTTSAPAARGYHTAVWTGSEMIVWGGFGNGSSLNTGGRYTPGPGIGPWTATSTTTNAHGEPYTQLPGGRLYDHHRQRHHRARHHRHRQPR